MTTTMPPDSLWLKPFFTALAALFGNRPRRNEPLSLHTTSRLGGPADVWLSVNSAVELARVITLARQYHAPLFVLGSGANLLISDAGIRGLVIGNRAGKVHFPAENEPPLLFAESGVVLPNLVRRCTQRGLSGLEWAVSVPGTLGGAVTNNAGAYGGNMAATLLQAEMLSPAGEQVWKPVSWFQYGYRTSRIKRASQRDWIILQAKLQLTRSSVAAIQTRIDDVNARRKRSQPPGATMGSMFKNPPGDYAGRLIEAAGLKGYQIGQAQISPVHANFFQNLGGATATEMMLLAQTAQTAVEAKFGVMLELEIEVFGEFYP